MQKVTSFYLKIGKAPGPDNIQAELIKTMSPEQLRVIQLWLNEVLAEGKPITRVTEKGNDGKGGPTSQRRIEGRPAIPLETSGIVELNQLAHRLHSQRKTHRNGGKRTHTVTDTG